MRHQRGQHFNVRRSSQRLALVVAIRKGNQQFVRRPRQCDIDEKLLIENRLASGHAQRDPATIKCIAIIVVDDGVFIANARKRAFIEPEEDDGFEFRMATPLDRPDEHLIDGRRNQSKRKLCQPGVDQRPQLADRMILIAQRVLEVVEKRFDRHPHLSMLGRLGDVTILFAALSPLFNLLRDLLSRQHFANRFCPCNTGNRSTRFKKRFKSG